MISVRESLWRRRDLLALALAAANSARGSAGLRVILPEDESSKDQALAGLLRRVRDLAGKTDFAGLEGLMAPDFRVEFDVGKGPRAFHAHWRPEAASSPLWPMLSRLFSMGGTFYSPTLFAVPYVYTRFPAAVDPLGHLVAVRKHTRLTDAPSEASRIAGYSDFEILPLAKPLQSPVLMSDRGYFEVVHPAAGRCFVEAASVYSPAGHRTFFEKRNGHWRWISLAAATYADPPELSRTKRRS